VTEVKEALNQPPPDVPMEFTLVQPPENPTPPEPDQKTPYRSTVSSAASDQDPRNTNSNTPHSTGKFPVPDNPGHPGGSDGGGKAELPPMPPEEEGLGDALKRSKWTNEQAPTTQPSFADETEMFDEPGSARASIGGISLSTTDWDFAPYLL